MISKGEPTTRTRRLVTQVTMKEECRVGGVWVGWRLQGIQSLHVVRR